MESFFKDKVYLVSGGNRGIGLGIVTLLLEYGAYVYATDLGERPSEGLEALPQDKLVYFEADVRSRPRSKEVVQQIMKKHQRLDGLVNCAGICPLEGEMPGDDLYEECFDTNVRGTWNLGTEALAVMKEQKSGSIVNIGSLSALKGVGKLPLYTSTKHAVLGLTKTWALDFAKYGVRVNMVNPGPTDTFMVRNPLKVVMGPIVGLNKTEDELLEYVVKSIPLGRLGQPRDIANAVAFFLSDFSSWTTGQQLTVAGGQ